MWVSRTDAIVRALACAGVVALACREPNPDFVPPGTEDGSASASTSAAASAAASSEDGVSTDDSTSAESGGPACGVDAAPVGGGCPDVCEPGCAQALCTIECEAWQCAGEVVQCPPGFECHVRCEDDGACEGATIVCPPEHACHVECDADRACADAVVVCAAGTCLLECQDGDAVCDDTSQSCGTNESVAECDNSSVDASPLDGSSCACEGC